MHPTIYNEFERICARQGAAGDILEIGAIPTEASLLCMKSLSGATSKIGLDLSPPSKFEDFQILQGNSNKMDCFEDDRFDVVLTNATFEHDKRFWLTVSEIKRVAKPGALIVIGAPAFVQLPQEKRLQNFISKLPLVGKPLERRLRWLYTSTLTFIVHPCPGDYYRFSSQAFKEVFFDGMTNIKIKTLMVPPRIIGFARNQQKGAGS